MTWTIGLDVAGIVISLLLLVFARWRVKWLQGEQLLLESEVTAMRRDGKFSGEPDYMQTFRVADSEGALLNAERAEQRWTTILIWCVLFATLDAITLIITTLVH